MASTSKDKENNAEVEGEKKPLIPPEKKGPENDIYRQVGTVSCSSFRTNLCSNWIPTLVINSNLDPTYTQSHWRGRPMTIFDQWGRPGTGFSIGFLYIHYWQWYSCNPRK